MKLRHAAALALVGWYLLLPPTGLTGVDSAAPLSKWIVYKEYESVAGCVTAQTELRFRSEQDPTVKPMLEFPIKQRQQFAAAQCILADDPRLKEPSK